MAKKAYTLRQLIKRRSPLATYSATVVINSWNKNQTDSRFAYFHFEFEADNQKAAKKVLLKKCRQRLNKFKIKKDRHVSIHCAPRFKTSKKLNGSKLIRNVHRFSSIASIMRVGANRLFVEGYGANSWDELTK